MEMSFSVCYQKLYSGPTNPEKLKESFKCLICDTPNCRKMTEIAIWGHQQNMKHKSGLLTCFMGPVHCSYGHQKNGYFGPPFTEQ